MIRLAALLTALLVAGCERPPVEPRPETNAAPAFDNAAASQSIMQPEVAAENPPEPTPSASPRPTVPRSVTIGFARGATLDDAARAMLDDFAAKLPGDVRLVLRGHSDSPGSDAANLAQSRRRAEAVRAYLAERGIAPTRIEVIALGERRPIAPNANRDGSDDPAARARNRRVEIEVLPPAPASDIVAPGGDATPAAGLNAAAPIGSFKPNAAAWRGSSMG